MREVRASPLWRDGDFVKLWTGQTISEMGSVVTRTALPILAVLTLHARALELGILVASASIAVLLVGLYALEELHLSPFLLGLTVSAGGVGSLAATVLVGPLTARFGLGPTLVWTRITLRQLVTPARLLGRVNGTTHVLHEGIAPIGAIAGALVAEAFGIRVAVTVAVLGSFAGLLFLVRSPIRMMRAGDAVAL